MIVLGSLPLESNMQITPQEYCTRKVSNYHAHQQMPHESKCQLSTLFVRKLTDLFYVVYRTTDLPNFIKKNMLVSMHLCA